MDGSPSNTLQAAAPRRCTSRGRPGGAAVLLRHGLRGATLPHGSSSKTLQAARGRKGGVAVAFAPSTCPRSTPCFSCTDPNRRRTDARSLRRATKHLFAFVPYPSPASWWGSTLSTPPPTTKLLIECRDRRRPAGTANSNSAGRPDARPRLNVFYIPKDGGWPNLRIGGRRKAIKTN